MMMMGAILVWEGEVEKGGQSDVSIGIKRIGLVDLFSPISNSLFEGAEKK